MNKKYTAIILSILTLGIITYYFSRPTKTSNEQPTTEIQTSINKEDLNQHTFMDTKTWQSIAHDPTAHMLLTDTQQWLEIEEQAIWDEFAALGVSKEIYERYAPSYRSDYDKQNPSRPYISKKLNRHSVELVIQVLQEFSINPDAISFYPLGMRTPIATTDCAIQINETMFSQMTQKAKWFTIGHEAQHILFKDDSTFCIVEQLLHQRCRNRHLRQKALERFSRFLEARADYHSIMKHPDYAQGLIEFMNYMYQLGGENDISSHPLKKTRIALGEKILQKSLLA